MTSKKYIVITASVLYLFIIINLALWHGTVKTIFQQRDLRRMGSIATTNPITEDRHYLKHHAEFADCIASGIFESFDVLTIGDSFTNGKDGGSYPDYLVNQYGLKVLNARIGISGLYTLDKIGWLEKISPKVVILESVEREVQGYLGMKHISTESTAKQVKALMTRKAVKLEPNSTKYMPAILAQAVYKHFYNKIYHMLKPEQLNSDVYITKLDKPLFSNPGFENTLLHLSWDFWYLNSALNAEMVNQNLNTAARFLKAKGIKLVFFAAADKYDLYYPYITDKKDRPDNPFFQKMREVQGKEYIYIDTITPLRQALERGEQDVYWLGDTHWSHKGIKIFCDELVKYILPELH